MTLQEWLQSLGFNIVPILDGKRHRCDRNGTKKDDNVWYIGSSELTPSGKERVTLTIGDWTTGEQHTYKPDRYETFTDEERAYYAKRQKEAEENAKKELDARQAEAAKEAERIWQSADICAAYHPYLERKKLSTIDFGLRKSGETLLIPMRDSAGKLWGIQRIFPDGTKRFLQGQRITGTIFNFKNGTAGPLLICEGFATGASLAVSGFTVYVAFNAGNLKEVATAIRRLHPDVQIVMCGDDDHWGSSGKNVGREKAEEAAKQVGGIAVFPDFKGHVAGTIYNIGTPFQLEKPTDFNDLHCLEGLDEVRRQIQKCIGSNSQNEKDARFTEQTKGDNKKLGSGFQINGENRELGKDNGQDSKRNQRGSFPVDALGPLLSNVTKIISEKTSAPIEMVANSVLAGVCVAIQEHYNVSAFGSIRPISLYFVTIADSGERKSTVDSLALQPHYEWRDEKFKIYNTELESYKSSIENYDDKIKKSGVPRPIRPKAPVLFATEPTIEGLFFCLKYHRNSIGLFSDEGGSWLSGHSMKSENIRGTLGKLNSMWDGKPIDRIRRGSNEGEIDMLYNKRVASHIMIQSKLSVDLFGNEYAKSQGYLARCLVCKPKSMIGKRKFLWKVDIKEEMKHYSMSIKALLNQKASDPIVLFPGDGVVELVEKFHDELEPLQAKGEEYSFVREFASKLPEHCIRMAAMLEAFNNPEAACISKEWMERAIEIGRFYLANHCVTTKESSRANESDIEALKNTLSKRDSWKMRDVLRVCVTRLRHKDVLTPIIKKLDEDGFCSYKEDSGTIEMPK